MTDKELLSKAAKAAGAELTDYSDRTPDHLTIKHADGIWREWNPLTDDGDALRLALKLRINVEHMAMEVMAHKGDVMCVEPNDDVYAAARRVIVRAAAALAK